MNLRPDRLEAALQKTLAPVYLIAGSEPLIVEECRDAVLAAAERRGYAERTVFVADARFDWALLDGAAAEQSLFAARRLIDLRIPTGKPGTEGGAWLTDWAERPDPERLLVVTCNGWDSAARKSKWANALAAAGVLVEAWPVRPEGLPEWIGSRMRARGLIADAEAVTLLAELVEGNLLAARQEIDKLALLHPNGAVTAEQVREAVGNNARFDAFRLGECLFVGRIGEALRVADGLRRTGVPIQAVAGALYFQLAQLDAVRDAIAHGEGEQQAFGRHRVMKMNQPAMQRALLTIDAQRLGHAFSALSRIDCQGKGQDAGDPWHTLDQMIVELAPGDRRRTAQRMPAR